MVFLRPMLGYYLDYATATSFPILSNASFIYHPPIRCYIVSVLKSSFNNACKKIFALKVKQFSLIP
jgi:hypothetical protein